LTFGQPLRQAYSVEHLLLCIDVNVQSAKRKAPIIIIPSRRHCCLYVLYVLYHLPTALSLSSYKQNQHKLPTCSWPLTHSLRLIRSLHLEKQPPHRRFLPPALTAAKSTSTSTQPDFSIENISHIAAPSQLLQAPDLTPDIAYR